MSTNPTGSISGRSVFLPVYVMYHSMTSQSSHMSQDEIYHIARDLYDKDVFAFIVLALRIRDARPALGNSADRNLSRKILILAAEKFPDIFVRLIPFIPEYGRWDDLLICSDIDSVSNAIYGFIVIQLYSDMFHMKSGLPVSACSVWMPNEGHTYYKNSISSFHRLLRALKWTRDEYKRNIHTLRGAYRRHKRVLYRPPFNKSAPPLNIIRYVYDTIQLTKPPSVDSVSKNEYNENRLFYEDAWRYWIQRFVLPSDSIYDNTSLIILIRSNQKNCTAAAVFMATVGLLTGRFTHLICGWQNTIFLAKQLNRESILKSVSQVYHFITNHGIVTKHHPIPKITSHTLKRVVFTDIALCNLKTPSDFNRTMYWSFSETPNTHTCGMHFDIIQLFGISDDILFAILLLPQNTQWSLNTVVDFVVNLHPRYNDVRKQLLWIPDDKKHYIC